MFGLSLDLKPHNNNTRLYGMKRINTTLCCINFGSETTTTTGSGTSEIRFAPYVEAYHAEFLSNTSVEAFGATGNDPSGVLSRQQFADQTLEALKYTGQDREDWLNETLNPGYEDYLKGGGVFDTGVDPDITKNESPYRLFTNVNVNNAFFGVGYVMTQFPSLYDMYGKFMAGFDLEASFAEVFEDATNAPEINNLVSAESALLDDDYETNVLPRFELGARDINSVMSSSFIVGKALLEDSRTKSIAKFSAELKYKMIPVAVERWKTHLTWNTNVITKYAEIMRLFFSTKTTVEGFNYNMATKHQLWPFTVMQFVAAAQGALTGTQSTTYSGSSETTSSSNPLSDILGVASGALSLFE